MPHRAANIVLAIAGICAIAVLAVLGRNAYRAAASGPLWKRRLLGAGLFLLATMGLASCEEPAGRHFPAVTAARSTERQSLSLDRFLAGWREAQEVAGGFRGEKPFTAKEKERLLAVLQTWPAEIDRFKASNVINEPEAGLLKLDLAQIVTDINKLPAKESDTHLASGGQDEDQPQIARIKARVPLLEKLAAVGPTSPDLEAIIITAAAGDLDTAREYLLESDDRDKHNRVLQKIHSFIRTDSPDLEKTSQWGQVTATWRIPSDLARSEPIEKDGDLYPFDNAGQRAMVGRVELAKLNVASLQHAGLLTQEEASLLTNELRMFAKTVKTYRPLEDQGATCYAGTPMFWDSEDGLKSRLPLLEKAVKDNKLPRQVVFILLKNIEMDLKDVAWYVGQWAPNDPQAPKRDTLEEATAVADRIESSFKNTQPLEQTDAWKKLVRTKDQIIKSASWYYGNEDHNDKREYLRLQSNVDDASYELVVMGLITRFEGKALREDDSHERPLSVWLKVFQDFVAGKPAHAGVVAQGVKRVQGTFKNEGDVDYSGIPEEQKVRKDLSAILPEVNKKLGQAK